MYKTLTIAAVLLLAATGPALAHEPWQMDVKSGRVINPLDGSLAPYGECPDFHHTVKPATGIKSVNVRTSPKTGRSFAQLARGTKVAFEGYAFDIDGYKWYKIRTPQGVSGWVTATAF